MNTHDSFILVFYVWHDTCLKLQSRYFHFKFFISKFALNYDFLWRVPDISLKNVSKVFIIKLALIEIASLIREQSLTFHSKLLPKFSLQDFHWLECYLSFVNTAHISKKSLRYLLCTKSFINWKLSLQNLHWYCFPEC